jgi:ADP-heptose:LPS heptosyltransferase
MVDSPGKILVLLPNNLGDVIMATPVLEGLKIKYPDCLCSFFVEEGFEAGLENNPHCDEIITFPRKKIKAALAPGPDERGFGMLRECISSLRARKFDRTVNLSQTPYVSFIAGLLASGDSAGRRFLAQGNHAIDDDWSAYLYAVAFARSCNSLHAVDIYRRIAGVTGHRGGYTVVITPQETHWAHAFLHDKNVDMQKKIMIFQPGAAFASKRWPLENFVRLGRLLVSDDWQIVVTGAPPEKDLALGIAQAIGQDCMSVAGETSFRQSMAICSIASGCVTGDTAQMHAAAACDVKTYAIFGPTNPVETGPYGSGHFVFSARCPKRPCFETDCKTGICMRSVLPETVFACIKEQGPGANPRCDLYTTAVEKDGDYRLIAVSGDAEKYFSSPVAHMTRRAFEETPIKPEILGPEYEIAMDGSRQWLEELEAMNKALDDFQKTGNADFVRFFEEKKSGLTKLKGPAEFWTALLNIGLNGIPLIDAREAVVRSREVCAALDRRIRNAINPHAV